VGPRAHEHEHLVEGDPVSRHVEHRLAGRRRQDLAVDGGHEGPVGLLAHHAELLDGGEAGRPQRVDGAGPIRRHEVVEGPPRFAQLHLGPAEASAVAGALLVALPGAGGRRRAGRRIEDADVGVPVGGRHAAGEVEPRIRHDDRRRHHGPADVIAAAPGQEADEAERRAGGGATRAPGDAAGGPGETRHGSNDTRRAASRATGRRRAR
jgi:hypothetical protein